jgi:hypothetical protein
MATSAPVRDQMSYVHRDTISTIHKPVFGRDSPQSCAALPLDLASLLVASRRIHGSYELVLGSSCAFPELSKPPHVEDSIMAGVSMSECPSSPALVRLAAQCRWAVTQAQQQCKIREIGYALASAGFCTLDDQAKALGIGRSTTWTILKATHKSSGLSVGLIERILSSPELPPEVRAKVLEYARDKAFGVYGHSPAQRRRFWVRLSVAASACAGISAPAKVATPNIKCIPEDELSRSVRDYAWGAPVT